MTFFPGNKALDAVAKTILLFGFLHILVLLIAFLKTGDISIFSIARILEINRILPIDVSGATHDVISFLFVALVYGIVYSRFSR